MKNFNKLIPFTKFKRIAFDLAFRPRSSSFFKLFLEAKKNCNFPGVYFNLCFLNIFSIWISVYDDYEFVMRKPESITNDQLKNIDGLLGDLVYWYPKFHQCFSKYDDLPESVVTHKGQAIERLNSMEGHLRGLLDQN